MLLDMFWKYMEIYWTHTENILDIYSIFTGNLVDVDLKFTRYLLEIQYTWYFLMEIYGNILDTYLKPMDRKLHGHLEKIWGTSTESTGDLPFFMKIYGTTLDIWFTEKLLDIYWKLTRYLLETTWTFTGNLADIYKNLAGIY